MVPLVEVDEYTALIEQRQQLFIRLIKCTDRQIQLLSNNEEEQITGLFDDTVQEWNQCTLQIDRIQNILKPMQLEQSNDSTELEGLLQKLAANVEQAKRLIEQSTEHTGTDLMHTRTQRKLMNAYYGMENTDQIPLYFDKKN